MTWQAVDRVTISDGNLEQAINVTVGNDGHPMRVRFQRWSDANPKKTYPLQPFGGDLSAFKTFDDFTVPTHSGKN